MLADAGREGVALGEDDHLLLCLSGENPGDPEEIRTGIANTLGVNKAAISVRCLDSLPRLSNGKVDYQKLAGAC